MFALPNVEIASHSYSHPFKWGLAEAGVGESYHLDIPGYVFNIQRETKDSIDYINRRLVPPGKKKWKSICGPAIATRPPMPLPPCARPACWP